MNRRNFIKKSFIGIGGLLLLPFVKPAEAKEIVVETYPLPPMMTKEFAEAWYNETAVITDDRWFIAGEDINFCDPVFIDNRKVFKVRADL